jgi:hypothetical protein
VDHGACHRRVVPALAEQGAAGEVDS